MDEKWRELRLWLETLGEKALGAKDYISKMDEKQKKRAVLWSALLVVLLLAAALIRGISGHSETPEVAELLGLGNRYLEEADYEAAILTFDEIIVIEPKCEEAYIGKATAQYMLSDYEGAIDTIEQGLDEVGESESLLELLEQITEEWEMDYEYYGPDDMDEGYASEKKTLVLNYSRVSRMTNTSEPEIQLVILNEEKPMEDYTWTTDNEEIATVTSDGLVTCQGEEGVTMITVRGDEKTGTCIVNVTAEGEEYNRAVVELPASSGEDGYIYVSYTTDGDGTAVVTNEFDTANYVYYAGNIEIPEALEIDGQELSITALDNRIFDYSSELTRIVIPAGVSSIGEDPSYGSDESLFSNCWNLEEIVVDEANPYYKSVDGVLYSKDGTRLIAYPAAKEGSSYEIPAEVERILVGAFGGCRNLEEILVADGNAYYESMDGVLVEKENHALLAYPSGREQTEYIIPEAVESIGRKAFTDGNLRRVVLGDTVNWGYESFYYCPMLEEIDGTGSVESVWVDYWQGCDNLKKIRAGSGVTEIDAYGYDGNTGFAGCVEIENLAQLQNLESFRTSGKVENIGDIKVLSNLRRLDIVESGEFEFSMLRNLTKLTQIDIYAYDELVLDDLSWISGLKELEYLSLNVNEFDVTDLSALSELLNLQNVYIGSIETGKNAEKALFALRTQYKEMENKIPNININALSDEQW